MRGMELTAQQELDKIETTLIALIEGTQAESVSVGEEHNQGARFKPLFDRRESLTSRGTVSTVLTDATLLQKIETRISEYISGDDDENVTIGEETVRNVRLTHLQAAQKAVESRTSSSDAGIGTPFSYYEPCGASENCGSSSFFNVEAGY